MKITKIIIPSENNQLFQITNISSCITKKNPPSTKLNSHKNLVLHQGSKYSVAAGYQQQPALWPPLPAIFHPRKRFISESNAAMKHLHTYNCNKLRNVNNCVDSCRSSLRSFYLYLLALFFSGVVLYVINNATFEETGQTRGNSAAAIQFSFSNRANFHSRFLCCQYVFDPVPLSTLSLFSCAFEFSSNLICWRPKEIDCRAKNQCHCCGIYHFQRPDLICEMPASDLVSPPSIRFPCSREKSSRQKRR